MKLLNSHDSVLIMISYTTLLVLFVSTGIECTRNCDTVSRPLKYYRIMECKRSTLPMMSWSDVSSLRDCISFAKKKRGSAFNYSPRGGREFINGSMRNCQILSCPEIDSSNTLVSDTAFDYYSAFGHLNSTSNATCIKNIGIFGDFHSKENYMNSLKSCKLFGGDLADVSSEVKTKHLSELINTTLDNWYRVAYVGMNDMKREGNFVTASGLLLSCSNYRAWAPGHPRSLSENEDCVVLDSEKLWRVVNCSAKFPALCEFFSGEPIRSSFFQKECKKIKNKLNTETCKQLKQLKNTTRTEKCTILNSKVSP